MTFPAGGGRVIRYTERELYVIQIFGGLGHVQFPDEVDLNPRSKKAAVHPNTTEECV